LPKEWRGADDCLWIAVRSSPSSVAITIPIPIPIPIPISISISIFIIPFSISALTTNQCGLPVGEPSDRGKPKSKVEKTSAGQGWRWTPTRHRFSLDTSIRPGIQSFPPIKSIRNLLRNIPRPSIIKQINANHVNRPCITESGVSISWLWSRTPVPCKSGTQSDNRPVARTLGRKRKPRSIHVAICGRA